MSGTGPRVPVFSTRFLRAWPTHAAGPVARYTALAHALVQEYPTDAHFAAYALPALPRRLARATLWPTPTRPPVPRDVFMALAVFDVDCAAAHAGRRDAVDSWWEPERPKVAALLDHHRGGFVYRTRGGYRIVYVLAPRTILRTETDAEQWSARYLAWVDYLERGFGIQADRTCKDWTRLFRLPHATRDGGHPERLPTLGDPHAVGPWVCDALPAAPPPGPARCGWRSPPIPTGRATSYGKAALRRAASDVAGAGLGHRNATTNAAAYSLGRLVAGGHLCATDVEETLLAASCAQGYLEETGESAVRAVIASGMAAGVAAGPRGPSLPWAYAKEDR